MKKYLFFLALSFSIFTVKTNAQIQVTSEGFVQVDYTSGDQSLTFGDNAGTDYPNRGKWALEYYNGGINFWIPWPNTTLYGGNYRLFLEDNTGYLGLNNGNPSYQLDVNGDIATYGTIRISSDERFKTDIKTITSSLDNLKKLEGVSYKMKKYRKSNVAENLHEIKDEAKLKTVQNEIALSEESIPEAKRFGFIAQKLKEVYPDLVDEDESGYLNVDYIGLIPVLVEAIKEQQAEIDALKLDMEKSKNRK